MRKPPLIPGTSRRMTPNRPVKSWRKGKKKAVYACKGAGTALDRKEGEQCKLLHFGDSSASDMTQHHDRKRQASYKARHGAIKTKSGKPAYKDKLQAAYWSWNVLW